MPLLRSLRTGTECFRSDPLERDTSVGGSTLALSRGAIASGRPYSTGNKGVVAPARTDFRYGPQPLIPRCESRIQIWTNEIFKKDKMPDTHHRSQRSGRKPCNKDLCRADRHQLSLDRVGSLFICRFRKWPRPKDGKTGARRFLTLPRACTAGRPTFRRCRVAARQTSTTHPQSGPQACSQPTGRRAFHRRFVHPFHEPGLSRLQTFESPEPSEVTTARAISPRALMENRQMKWTLGIQAKKSYYPNITCRACCHCARPGQLALRQTQPVQDNLV